MTLLTELDVVRHRLDKLVLRRLESDFLAYERAEWTKLIERETELLATAA